MISYFQSKGISHNPPTNFIERRNSQLNKQMQEYTTAASARQEEFKKEAINNNFEDEDI